MYISSLESSPKIWFVNQPEMTIPINIEQIGIFQALEIDYMMIIFRGSCIVMAHRGQNWSQTDHHSGLFPDPMSKRYTLMA